MSLPVRCDLCGSDILPVDDDGDIMGGGTPWWGNRYEMRGLVKRGWFKRNELGPVVHMDAHTDCMKHLFGQKGKTPPKQWMAIERGDAKGASNE